MRARDLRGTRPVLQAVGVAQAADEVVDVAGLCRELELPEGALHERLRVLEGWGLILTGLEEGLTPILRHTGRQYLAFEGSVDPAVLGFLPLAMDDLHARHAPQRRNDCRRRLPRGPTRRPGGRPRARTGARGFRTGDHRAGRYLPIRCVCGPDGAAFGQRARWVRGRRGHRGSDDG
jgi:hypothetical protein